MSANNTLADLVKALQGLTSGKQGDDYIDNEARASRPEKICVDIRTTFIRVIDVDTCKQQYAAEVFLQARWQEPALTGKTQKELDDMDLRGFWDPLLRINNVVGDLDENKKWRKALRAEPGSQHPLMIYRQRIRGTFSEPLELNNFPVDVQALTLKVISERGNQEVTLVEDIKELSCVNTQNFSDEHEWLIYEHVDTTILAAHSSAREYYAETHGKISVDDSTKHPAADFECHVARRPGYFMWNIILVIFLLTALTFCAWAIHPALPEFRLPVVLILLLTCIVFRFVMGNFLPAMPYISYLDIYQIAGLIFICLQVIAVCVSSVYAKQQHVNASRIDTYIAFAMAILLAIFNVIYLAFLFIMGFAERQKMVDKDEEYHYRRLQLRERRGKKAQHPPKARPGPAPQRPPPHEKPKIVYIDADKKNDVNDVQRAPTTSRKAKKQRTQMPPPNFPQQQVEEKVFTIVPLHS